MSSVPQPVLLGQTLTLFVRLSRRGVIQAVHVVTVLLRTPHPTRSSLGSVLDSGATLVESVAAVGMPV